MRRGKRRRRGYGRRGRRGRVKESRRAGGVTKVKESNCMM